MLKFFKYNKKHRLYFLFPKALCTFSLANTKEESHGRDVTKRNSIPISFWSIEDL